MTPGAKLARCITVASMLLCALPGAAQLVTDLPEAHSPVTLLAVTVNGALRPQIPIAAGERQFWRIVNASPEWIFPIRLFEGCRYSTVIGLAMRTKA